MVKLSLAVFIAALLSVAVASAVPYDAREARIIKVRALRDAAEQANLTKRQGNSAFGHSQGNGRDKPKGGHGHNGPDLDFDPKNCGRPFFECPASYNGVGTPHCDYGHCKLRCPPGWTNFLSHHPELPNFCAPA
ncbi:hypothetical protein JCM8208_007662 [Rhodotorula glutinis]